LRGGRSDLDLIADLDTGAIDAYFNLDLLAKHGLFKEGTRDYEDESEHPGQSFRFITKPLRLSVTDKNGQSREAGFFAFCIKNWHNSPFVAINPNRTALIGRSVFFKIAPVIHLDFAARQTEIEFHSSL